jgi:hypothetical protein
MFALDRTRCQNVAPVFKEAGCLKPPETTKGA